MTRRPACVRIRRCPRMGSTVRKDRHAPHQRGFDIDPLPTTSRAAIASRHVDASHRSDRRRRALATLFDVVDALARAILYQHSRARRRPPSSGGSSGDRERPAACEALDGSTMSHCAPAAIGQQGLALRDLAHTNGARDSHAATHGVDERRRDRRCAGRGARIGPGRQMMLMFRSDVPINCRRRSRYPQGVAARDGWNHADAEELAARGERWARIALCSLYCGASRIFRRCLRHHEAFAGMSKAEIDAPDADRAFQRGVGFNARRRDQCGSSRKSNS